MGDLRRAGALWIMAGLSCVGLLIFVFVGENLADLGVLLKHPALPGLVLGGAIVALLLGVLLIVRPGPRVVRWSTAAGVAWLIAFGSVAITSLGKPAVLSSGLITGLGVAGALAAHRSRVAEPSPEVS
jgi:hypothetical protein